MLEFHSPLADRLTLHIPALGRIAQADQVCGGEAHGHGGAGGLQ